MTTSSWSSTPPASTSLQPRSSSTRPAWAEKICDVPADRIQELARAMAKAAPAASIEASWRAVIGCSYANSFETARVITAVNSLLGAWGAKGGALLTSSPKAGKIEDARFADPVKPEKPRVGNKEYPLRARQRRHEHRRAAGRARRHHEGPVLLQFQCGEGLRSAEDVGRGPGQVRPRGHHRRADERDGAAVALRAARGHVPGAFGTARVHRAARSTSWACARPCSTASIPKRRRATRSSTAWPRPAAWANTSSSPPRTGRLRNWRPWAFPSTR